MKKIWKLVLNDLISSATIQSFNVYTIWYIASNIKDQRIVALFGSVQIVNILLSPLGGVIADEYRRDRIIKITSFIRSISFVIFLILILILRDFRYLIIGMSLLLSCISSFYTPAIESVVPNISLNDEELFKNNTYINMANQLSSIIGAGIGSFLIFIVKPSIVYLIITVLIIVSTSFVMHFTLTIPQEFSHRNDFKKIFSLDGIKRIVLNIKMVLNTKIIRVLFPYACLINLSFWVFYYLMPVYLNIELSKYSFAYSLQEFVIALSAFICGTFMSRYSQFFIKRSSLYSTYLFLQSFGICLMPLLFHFIKIDLIKLIVLIFAWALYGVFNFLSGLIFITKIQQEIDKDKLGVTIGIIFSVFGALGPISAALSGLITKPNSIIMLFISMSMLLVTVVMMFDKRISKVLK